MQIVFSGEHQSALRARDFSIPRAAIRQDGPWEKSKNRALVRTGPLGFPSLLSGKDTIVVPMVALMTTSDSPQTTAPVEEA